MSGCWVICEIKLDTVADRETKNTIIAMYPHVVAYNA